MPERAGQISTFAERLTSASKSAGLSGNRLAGQVGVSQGVISKWATGKSEPTREHLVALSQALKVRVEWLAAGTGPMWAVRNAIDPGELIGVTDLGGGPATEMSAAILAELEIEPSRARIYKAGDDSMAPIFRTKDLLICEGVRETFAGPGIYGIRVPGAQGTSLVRTVTQRANGQLVATAEAAGHAEEKIKPSALVARVLYVIAKVSPSVTWPKLRELKS